MSFHVIGDGDWRESGREPKFSIGDKIICGGYKGEVIEEPVYGYPRGGGRTSLYYKAFMVATWSEYDKSDRWLREEEMRKIEDAE